MLLFEDNGNVIGFGLFGKLFNNRPECDIGICVDKEHRKMGYGSYIAQFMVEYCENRKLMPQAGCTYENIGSRKTLEKAGFLPQYRLLEFTVK